ncbi:MAG: hypothetical protein E4H09_04495 [Spirochaetales bacterium]|nr:MAG: hypothetical protein E4H09_04495 [Spirochaetales bacterium]
MLGDVTPEEIAAFNDAAALVDDAPTIPELSNTGFYVSAPMTGGWAFRAFGGISLNLIIVNLDITGMYDFIGNNFGATVGLRVQL